MRGGGRCRLGRIASRILVSAATAAGTLAILTGALGLGGAVPAGASTGCGMTLGTPQVLGALGSFIFDVPTIPAVAGQVCNATISVTGTIASSGGTRPNNVNGNGQAVTLTVRFLPDAPPPDLFWQWSPHCADPVSNAYRFTASSPTAGTASSMSLDGAACSSFGNVTASTLLSPFVIVSDPATYVGMASTPGNLGYWLAQRGGGIGTEGNATNKGMPFGNVAVVGMTAASSGGYWVATADGGVWSYGAPFFGSLGATPLNAPIVGIVSTPDHGGYWLVASDGGVFAFGDAKFFGSVPGVLPPGVSLNEPVVGIASTADGQGYWMVASDGGIFSFGDAHFWGSMGGTHLNKPVVGMAANGVGGYWLVASDGGLFSFHATFYGSLGGIPLVSPVTGMAATSDAGGYWMVAGDGGVFAFGDAPFWGSPA